MKNPRRNKQTKKYKYIKKKKNEVERIQKLRCKTPSDDKAKGID